MNPTLLLFAGLIIAIILCVRCAAMVKKVEGYSDDLRSLYGRRVTQVWLDDKPTADGGFFWPEGKQLGIAPTSYSPGAQRYMDTRPIKTDDTVFVQAMHGLVN